ncbi:MAG: glutamate 5-kinase, partial [Spirochaetia bacterium]|nr:glutamate 5-kinase [Spirochaetia bacterium]
ILWSADLLLLFSDIDGIYTDNPKTNPQAKLIEKVDSIPELRKEITIGETNAFGTGGIETKIQAANKVTEYGIQMILANGGAENAVETLYAGKGKGTLFQVK